MELFGLQSVKAGIIFKDRHASLAIPPAKITAIYSGKHTDGF